MITLRPKQFSDWSKLFSMTDPPNEIFCDGNLQVLRKPMISIIGARDIQAWVVEWMENELSQIFKSFDLTVVSGGARGVDQMAHRLALRHGCSTVIVVPSGLGNIYPANIRSWRVSNDVLFLTEYQEDEPMRKHHFYKRNRLIVGMTNLTFVLQAREKSGSMMSARLALESGKSVVTLPASPMDPSFSGNNQLIYDGAHFVRDHRDIKQILYEEGFVEK